MDAQAASLHEFARRLKALRLAAGAPSYGQLARLHPDLKTSTISDVLAGRSRSSLDFVVAFVDACRRYAGQAGQALDPALSDVDRWREEWMSMRRTLDATRGPARSGLSTGQPPAVGSGPPVPNLPRRPAPTFLGRDRHLRELARELDDHKGIIIGQAVHGLGGVGKTELALQYAHAHRDRHRPIWWVRADTPANVTADLSALARALRLPAAGTHGLAETAEQAVRWLAANEGWLLVLDNVTDPADIMPLLAAFSRGRVIATSQRDVDWSEVGLLPLRLEPLDREASVRLLRERSGREIGAEPVDLLAGSVGDLPLALRQAAAYLRERPHVSVQRYLRRLAEQPARVLGGVPATGGIHPVTRTWGVTIAAMRRQCRLAVELLGLLAYLAPDDIAVELLVLPGRDPLDVEDALAVAASFSMVNRQGDSVGVHRLVQALFRAGHPDLVALGQVVDLLVAAAPTGEPESDVASWPRWNRLAAHVDAVAGHLSRLGADGIEAGRVPDSGGGRGPDAGGDNGWLVRAAWLFDRCAQFRRGQGQHHGAIALFTLAVTLRERQLGPENAETVTARYGLAGAYWSAGRYADAIALGEEALAARIRILGPDHPDTLSNASNVGVGYRELGRLAEAVEISERTLAARLRVLGPRHPDTLQSQNNLAGCYRALRRYADALPLYEETLRLRESSLGAEHPDTLQSRNNLAGGYASLGRYAEAISLHEEALAARIRILGPDHPDTLRSQQNLADCHRAVGRLAEAEALYARVLRIRERLLGPDHPDTRVVRQRLTARYPGDPDSDSRTSAGGS